MAKGWSFSAFTEQIYNIIYPVGICIDFDNATNPNTAFPGTTWVQITDGRAARAATSTAVGTTKGQIGSVAGSDTLTLTAAHLPAHTHTMAHVHSISHSHAAGTAASDGAHTHTYSATTASSGAHTHTTSGTAANNGAHTHTVSGTAASAGAHTHTVSGTAASAGAHVHQTSHLVDNKNTPIYGRTSIPVNEGIFLTTAGWTGVTNAGYYKLPTQSTGAHTHTVSGTAASAGAHTHTVSGTAASAGAHTHTVSGTAASAGAHTHTVGGTTVSSGAHTHTVSIPSMSGNSGASSAASTGSVGSGAAFDSTNTCHYYARWKRTA